MRTFAEKFKQLSENMTNSSLWSRNGNWSSLATSQGLLADIYMKMWDYISNKHNTVNSRYLDFDYLE